MVTAKPVITADLIALATNENLVLMISAGNGEVISKTKTQFVPTAIALPDANTVIIGDERGYVWSNPINSEESNWKLRQGARISNIDLNGDKLLVTSFDNFIYSVNAGNGKVLWKKRMPGRINTKPDVSNDVAVTVSYGENTAFVISTKNGKSLNQLVLEGENSFVQGPVITGNSAVFATTDGIFGYGMTGCSAK
jgi:outer membrane protein assembly factor BamB